MTDEQCRAYLRKWQRAFGLKHWRITLHLIEASKLDLPTHSIHGYCKPDIDNRRATIWVANGLTPRLTKETIVHELMHALQDPALRLAEDALFEASLNRIAKLLVHFDTKLNQQRKHPHAPRT